METNYQKFLAGEYCNHLDQEVLQMIVQTKNLLARLNATNITDSATRDALLRQMLGNIGKYSSIDINFHCECGKHIFIGDKVIINMNCTFLDDNIIKIGNNVLIAPNVQLLDWWWNDRLTRHHDREEQRDRGRQCSDKIHSHL